MTNLDEAVGLLYAAMCRCDAADPLGLDTHRAIPGRDKDHGWHTCVTPEACAARPERQAAHGNITRTDVCSCGATRQAEINAGRTNYGPWEN